MGAFGLVRDGIKVCSSGLFQDRQRHAVFRLEPGAVPGKTKGSFYLLMYHFK
jgi:hypothetical protein